jgi:broad specificity phosphatase PhoE
MKRIYLSRHGESLYNLENRIGGNSNLSNKGEKYSIALSKYINNLNDDIIVLTSELIRTINTAKNIKYNKIQYKELNEINAGICEDLTYDNFKSIYPNEFNKRQKDKLNYRYPEGESYIDLINRLIPIIQIILNEKKIILIVAHQAILRVIYGILTKKTKQEIPFIKIPLHTLIRLEINSKELNEEIIKLVNFTVNKLCLFWN